MPIFVVIPLAQVQCRQCYIDEKLHLTKGETRIPSPNKLAELQRVVANYAHSEQYYVN